MGVRTVVTFGLGALLTAGFVLGWVQAGNEPELTNLPVPRFGSANAGDPNAARAARRETLLPVDCGEVLPGPVDAAALLAMPTGSVTARGIIGVGSPSVGLLERLTCNYFPAHKASGPPLMVIGLAAFTDQAGARAQRDRNIAAERTDTLASRPVPFGDAQATLLSQRDNYLLMVTYDRYTVTASVARRLVPEANAEAVLVDLVRRVWPGVLPPGSIPGGSGPQTTGVADARPLRTPG